MSTLCHRKGDRNHRSRTLTTNYLYFWFLNGVRASISYFWTKQYRRLWECTSNSYDFHGNHARFTTPSNKLKNSRSKFLRFGSKYLIYRFTIFLGAMLFLHPNCTILTPNTIHRIYTLNNVFFNIFINKK